VVALSEARDRAPAAVQSAVQESLLKCAERLAAGGDNPGALAIYRGLFDTRFPVQIWTAAWRGLALSDSEHRANLVLEALASPNRPIRNAARKLLRELGGRQEIQTCLGQWASLPPDSQLALLDAQMKLGAEAVPTARLASQSPNATLRAAAWQALGELNDAASIPGLAKAAAGNEPAESQAARESLARLRGPEAREALFSQIASASTPEKAELLRALGERGDRAVAKVLLQHAVSDAQPVRLAALESLRKLAPPEAGAPLLDLAAGSKTDEERDPLLKALYAVYEASPNQAEAARNIIGSIGRYPTAQRRQVLPLLAEIGTADALEAAQAASRDSDLELAKEAVRVLSQWPNAGPAARLLELARAGTEPTLRVLASRGAIAVAGQEPDTAKRLALLQQALAAAERVDEKKQALGQVGQIPTSDALNLALSHLTEPGLAGEAGLAAVSIAEKLAPTNSKLADEAAVKVLAQIKEGDLARRAWSLRLKPGSDAPFIRDWLLCGPYRQAGVSGAQAVFNLVVGPEKAGEKVAWSAVPREDAVNLAALFPGQENCVAYLRTRIIAPKEGHGVLLMGSDDGIKAWLNGEVVHSNNVDRGQVVDQDAAPIRLNQGTNELMLKVTQGGGGWGACARIVGTDLKPIPGLRIECP
jgi:HEAT repeat protein